MEGVQPGTQSNQDEAGQARDPHPVRFVAVGAHDGLLHAGDALLGGLQEALQLIQGESARTTSHHFVLSSSLGVHMSVICVLAKYVGRTNGSPVYCLQWQR